jgi:large subunit ribosomal protein L29|tara:strand:+ start:291 stop:491 length:201 start_codon:yes stop_codon:yes gene_type:complete
MISKKQNSSNLSKMRAEVVALKRNLMNLKFQKSTGQLEKTAEIKKTRSKIARLKTNMNQILGEQDA